MTRHLVECHHSHVLSTLSPSTKWGLKNYLMAPCVYMRTCIFILCHLIPHAGTCWIILRWTIYTSNHRDNELGGRSPKTLLRICCPIWEKVSCCVNVLTSRAGSRFRTVHLQQSQQGVWLWTRASDDPGSLSLGPSLMYYTTPPTSTTLEFSA